MLFLISLEYTQPLEEVGRHLEGHRVFLENHFQAGHFLLSGPKQPRTGGMILVRAETREEVMQWITEDPFHEQGVATFEVVGWEPSMSAPEIAL